MKSGEFIPALVRRVAEADDQGPLPHKGAEHLSGHSGSKVLALLQRLPSLFTGEDASYLEVGVFQGLTLLSVAAANPGFECYGVDNFAFFDPEGRNRDIVLERVRRLELRNAHLIDSDYEDALEGLASGPPSKPIGVYFVDGPHDYRSQLMCLLLAKPYLHPRAVIVVDDANYAHVRQANRDFLYTHPDFKLLFEAYTSAHPSVLSEDQRERVRSGWWNGINVMVRDPEGALAYKEPPTVRDRTRFENDHLVHSARLAEFAPLAVRAMDALFGGRLPTAAVLLGQAWRGARLRREEVRQRVRTRNTFSAALEGAHWNGNVEVRSDGTRALRLR